MCSECLMCVCNGTRNFYFIFLGRCRGCEGA